MENSHLEDLEGRVAQLESKLDEVIGRLDRGEMKSPEPTSIAREISGERSRIEYPLEESEPKKELWERIELGENWLNKIGIGLLLLGLVFLFKLAVDRGWITPSIRVLFGLVLGGGLIFWGRQIHQSRKAFGSVILGGGIAALYISIFSAFQLFDLVPHSLAFGAMLATTLLAFYLSIYLDEWTTSLIAVVGGLATPFLLHTPDGNLLLFLAYVSLIVSFSASVYLIKGWTSLLSVASIGGFSVLGIAITNASGRNEDWLICCAILLVGLILWQTPVWREIRAPWQIVKGSGGFWPSLKNRYSRNQSHFYIYAVPLIATGLIGVTMPSSFWTNFNWGYVPIIVGALFFVFGLWIRSRDKKLGNNHVISALVLICLGGAWVFDDRLHFTSLGIAAASIALLYLAKRFEESHLEIASFVFSIVLSLDLIGRFMDAPNQPAIVNVPSFCYLLAIACLIFSSFRLVFPIRWILRWVAHVAVLAWLARELGSLDGGQAYVSIAWGIYSISLIIWGLVKRSKKVRIAGMATLLLVVAKLLLVDLAQLDAIWRIILFLGFGALLLFLSFYLPKLSGEEPQSVLEGDGSEQA